MKKLREERLPVVEQCQTAGLSLAPDPKNKDNKIEARIPCRKIEGDLCRVYINPRSKWYGSGCPMQQRHIVEEDIAKINPLKASKRAQTQKG